MWTRDKRPLLQRDRQRKHDPAQTTAEVSALDFPEGVSSLGRTLTIKGELSASEHIIIDGRFEGRIVLPDHGLAIGMHANVKADVLAKSVTVLGVLTGNLTVGERTDICDTAMVEGEIVSARIALAEGAQFNGTVDTKRAATAVAVARHRVKQEAASLASAGFSSQRFSTSAMTTR